MMMSFCSRIPPRRRRLPWGLKDPEPWSDEPSFWLQGTSKLAARGGRPRYSGMAGGTCREQERAPCARPRRTPGPDLFGLSGSGRDREDWTWISLRWPQLPGKLRFGETARDWSEVVSMFTGVQSWQLHLKPKKRRGKRGKMRQKKMIEKNQNSLSKPHDLLTNIRLIFVSRAELWMKANEDHWTSSWYFPEQKQTVDAPHTCLNRTCYICLCLFWGVDQMYLK